MVRGVLDFDLGLGGVIEGNRGYKEVECLGGFFWSKSRSIYIRVSAVY